MPNHTSNCVDVSVKTGCSKEQLALAELKTMLAINSEEFDFNGIIPMPIELNKGRRYSFDNCPSDYKNEGGCYVPKSRNVRDKWIKNFGFDNWYDWSNANWGTKWNSYDVDVDANFDDELTVQFFTAWSCPFPIFAKMKEYCQEHNLNLSWDVCFEGEDDVFDLMDEDMQEWGA